MTEQQRRAQVIAFNQNKNTAFLTYATSAQLKYILTLIPLSSLKIICKKAGKYSNLYEVRLRGVQYIL